MKKILFSILMMLASSVYSLSPIADAQKDYFNKVVNYTDAVGLNAEMLQTDFTYLKNLGVVPESIDLMVKEKSSLASAMSKELIVVNVKLAKYNRLERLFVLAHEAGHIVNNDREDTYKLFNQYIPDNITKTEAYHRFNELKPQLCVMLHTNEYEADDYAAQKLLSLGYSKEEVIAAVSGVLKDIAADLTHPASSDRIKRQSK